MGALGAAGLVGQVRTATAATTRAGGQTGHQSSTESVVQTAVELSAAPFEQVQQLFADDGDSTDSFGNSVVLDEGTALVGAASDTNENGTRAGAVYVFIDEDEEWTQTQTLLADDGAADDGFGRSVALLGDTALVGAPFDDNENGSRAGAVYVFTREDGEWSQTQKLIADSDEESGDFGDSIALQGDTALVGAQTEGSDNRPGAGAAYVFTRENGAWRQTQRLIASDRSEDDNFGRSVTLTEETALVGAPLVDTFEEGVEEDRGAVYVFVHENGEWSETQQLLPDDGRGDDFFGESISAVGDTVFIGAPRARFANGSTYVFTRENGEWTQSQQLIADDAQPFDRFGQSVALLGDTALIGAAFSVAGVRDSLGSAYVFTREDGEWSQTQKLLDEDGPTAEFFGFSVALSADTALIGAPNFDTENSQAVGTAYVFDRQPSVEGYQVDLAGGSVIDDLGADENGFYSAQHRLIRFINGNGTDGITASGRPPSLSDELRAAVDSDPITVDEDANTASVSFTVREESGPAELTFASYTLPGGRFDAATADQQVLTDFVTKTFVPGTYSLTVALPDQ